MDVPPFRLAARLAEPGTRYDLGASGFRAPPWQQRGLPAVATEPATFDHDQELEARLAHRAGLPPEAAVLTGGTSLANAATVAALVARAAVCETPCYEPLRQLPALFGATVKDATRGTQAQAIAEALPRRGLAVLSSPHNPTAAPLTTDALRTLGEAAEDKDAWVLVDQVYRELTDHPVAAAVHERLITTAGFNKCWGAPGLRLGWVLARPDVATRIRAAHQLLALAPGPTVAAHVLLDHEALCRTQLEERVATNQRTYRAWCQEAGITPGPHHGLVDFPRVPEGTIARATAAGILLPDGGFFGAPGHARIGLGGEPVAFAAALDALAPVLRGRPRKGH